MIKEFLEGIVIIKVSNGEESQYLLDIAIENGFEGSNSIFETMNYRAYPYYFIEDNSRLNASKDPIYEIKKGNAKKILRFEEAFPNVRV